MSVVLSKQVFYIARNDLLGVIEYTPYDLDGNPVDPQVTDSVYFSMRDQNSATPKIERGEAEVVDVVGGPNYFRYTWVEGDTDTDGTYIAEWEWVSGGKPRTIPNFAEAELQVRIRSDVA